MSTSRSLFLGLLLGTAVAGCASARGLPQPASTLHDGQAPVKILSAYLTAADPAVVRGMVRRAGPTRIASGHLHVTAFAADGSVVATRTARWRGVMSGRHPAAAVYQSDLGAHRAQIARIEVAYARDRHEPVEGFQ